MNWPEAPTTWAVTGTDTGVGKTEVTALLAVAARAAGLDVRAIKAVETGVHAADPNTDAARLGRAAGHPPLCGQTWRTPASPQRATQLEGAPFEEGAVRAFIQQHSSALTLVEGAGGWTVPLSDTLRWDTFVAETGVPVLVVAANRLGVLNHTLLTCEAIRSRGNPLVGVVLNHLQEENPEEADARAGNLGDLRHWLDVPVVAVPHLRANVDRVAEGMRIWRALRN